MLDALSWLSNDPDPVLHELQKLADTYLRRRSSGVPTFRRKREAAEKLAKTLAKYTKEEFGQVALVTCALLEHEGLAIDADQSRIANVITAVNKQIDGLSRQPPAYAHAERWVNAIFKKITGDREILSGLRKRPDDDDKPAPPEFDAEQMRKDMAHPRMVAARAARRAELETQFRLQKKSR